MIEIEFIGSGGQGAVVAARLLTEAATKGGYYSQSFASYGQARRGQKVESYVRISDSELRVHSKMYGVDYLVIMNESFAKQPEVTSVVKDGGVILINSPEPPEAFSSLGNFKIRTIDASRIAIGHKVQLPSGMPIINTVILGAVAAIIPSFDIKWLAEAIREGKVPAADRNIVAAKEAYQEVVGKVSVSSTRGSDIDAELEELSKRYLIYNQEKMSRCNRCMICYIFCPEHAITFTPNPFSLSVNHSLCKRCNICVEECPRKAISWGVPID